MIDLAALCIRIRSGEQEAVETLVMLLVDIRKGLRDELGDDAQDIFQEVCLRTVKAIQENRVEHPELVLAYAHSVSKHVKIRWLETQARLTGKLVSLDGKHPPTIPIPATQEEELIRKDALRVIWGARACLTELDQEIIQRSCFDDQPIPQIAAALDMTVEQVSVHKSRAISRLKVRYEQLTRPKELLAA